MIFITKDSQGKILEKMLIDEYFIKKPILNTMMKKYLKDSPKTLFENANYDKLRDIELNADDKMIFDFLTGVEFRSKAKYILATCLDYFIEANKIEGTRIRDIINFIAEMVRSCECETFIFTEEIKENTIVDVKDMGLTIPRLGIVQNIAGNKCTVKMLAYPFTKGEIVEIENPYERLKIIV